MIRQIEYINMNCSVTDNLRVMPVPSQVRSQSLQKMIKRSYPQIFGTSVQCKMNRLIRSPRPVMYLKLKLHYQHQQHKLQHCLLTKKIPSSNTSLQQMIEDNKKFRMRLQHDKILHSINPQSFRCSKEKIYFSDTRQQEGQAIEMLILRIQHQPQQVQIHRQYLSTNKSTHCILKSKPYINSQQQDCVEDKSQKKSIVMHVVITEHTIQDALEES